MVNKKYKKKNRIDIENEIKRRAKKQVLIAVLGILAAIILIEVCVKAIGVDDSSGVNDPFVTNQVVYFMTTTIIIPAILIATAIELSRKILGKNYSEIKNLLLLIFVWAVTLALLNISWFGILFG